MNKDKLELPIDETEDLKFISTELSVAVLQKVLNTINPELRACLRDLNVSAIAVNPIRDPETNQFRADQLKLGVNLNFK